MSKRKNGDAGTTTSPAKKAKSIQDGKSIYYTDYTGLYLEARGTQRRWRQIRSGAEYLGREARVAEEGQTIGGVAFSLANAVTLPEALNSLSKLRTHLALYFLPPPLSTSSAKT